MSIKYRIHKASDGLPLALVEIESGVRVCTFNQQLATRKEHAELIVASVNSTALPSPASAPEDWPNTNGRVVDAAGNAIDEAASAEAGGAQEVLAELLARWEARKQLCYKGNAPGAALEIANILLEIEQELAPEIRHAPPSQSKAEAVGENGLELLASSLGALQAAHSSVLQDRKIEDDRRSESGAPEAQWPKETPYEAIINRVTKFLFAHPPSTQNPPENAPAGSIESAFRDALNDDITAWLATSVVPTKSDFRLHNLLELVERLTGTVYRLSAPENAKAELPSYEECSALKDSPASTPLQRFIYNHEPMGDEDATQFRHELSEVLATPSTREEGRT